MITLITGLPGNGKTLFALWYVKMKAEKEQREVYYHNIKDLTLPWQAFDAEKWMDLPHGSIIVLDECQFVFPKKPNGSKLPDWYEQLATHRHRGFDIYLITQHPSLIDNFVRQLVGQHFHAVRKFGMQRATIYEWSAANPGPQNPSSQKSAIPMKWAYPKEVYGYYKSAEVHTVKRSIPAKLFLAVGFVVAVAFGGWWALDRYQHRSDVSKKPNQVVAAPAAVAPGAAPGGPGQSSTSAPAFDALADIKHYVDMQTPRVAGLPETAPKYDSLTVPKRVPVPAMCFQLGSAKKVAEMTCKCYSQQGTAMHDVPFNMCVQFAREGRFYDFDPDGESRGVSDANEARLAASGERSVAVLSNRADSPLPAHASGPWTYTIPDPDAATRPRGQMTSLDDDQVPDTGPPNNRSTRARGDRT